MPNHALDSRCRLSVWFIAAGVLLFASSGRAAEPHPSARWEKAISAFEQQDAKADTPQGGILFVGSSSIRGWDLPTYFPDLPVINRGFGGSQIADSVYYAGRVVLPYKPKVVVLYAGDNDIADGKSPERVAADYRAFVLTVQAALPETRILFVAIKPSLKRWQLVEKMRAANALVKQIIDQDERQTYIDVDEPMIGEDGKPRPELFQKDGLHLNPAGYKLWSSLVMPHLKSD